MVVGVSKLISIESIHHRSTTQVYLRLWRAPLLLYGTVRTCEISFVVLKLPRGFEIGYTNWSREANRITRLTQSGAPRWCPIRQKSFFVYKYMVHPNERHHWDEGTCQQRIKFSPNHAGTSSLGLACLRKLKVEYLDQVAIIFILFFTSFNKPFSHYCIGTSNSLLKAKTSHLYSFKVLPEQP